MRRHINGAYALALAGGFQIIQNHALLIQPDLGRMEGLPGVRIFPLRDLVLGEQV